MRLLLFAPFLVLAGCASSIERAKALGVEIPAWYTAKVKEVKGENYPRIADVPRLKADNAYGKALPKVQQATLADRELFKANPRAEPVTETPEDMQAASRAVMAAFEAGLPPPAFLSDADVARLRAKFTQIEPKR